MAHIHSLKWSPFLFLGPFSHVESLPPSKLRSLSLCLWAGQSCNCFWRFIGETGLRLENKKKKKLTCRLRCLIQISIAWWKDWQTLWERAYVRWMMMIWSLLEWDCFQGAFSRRIDLFTSPSDTELVVKEQIKNNQLVICIFIRVIWRLQPTS